LPVAESERRASGPEQLELAFAALTRIPGTTVAVFDRDLRYLLVAGEPLAERGLDPAAMEGNAIEQVLPAQWWNALAPPFRAALAGERGRVDLQSLDGRQTYEIEVVPWRDDTGAIVGGISLSRDVSELRASQDAAAHWQALASQTDDAIVSLDLDAVVTGWNAAAERMFGYSAHEMLGRRVGRLLTPPGGEAETEDLLERVRRGETIRVESPRRDREGRELVIARTISPIRDGRGSLVGASVIARDVTARKRLEDELRVSEERWGAVFDSPMLGVVVRSPDLRLLACNERFAEIFGLPREELLGTTLGDVLRADDAEALAAGFRERAAAEHTHVDFTASVTRRDGRRLELRTSVFAIDAGDGGARSTIAFIQDVTEQRRLEAELAQARRAEAIGRLAGGIAHELNNKLGVVIGFTERVSQRLAHDARSTAELAQVRAAADQAARLVLDLLAFGRRRALDREQLAVAEIVARLRRVLALALGADIELSIEDHSDRACVLGDRDQLVQVMVGLALNARDAMPHGGRLAIRITRESAEGNARVRIAVADDGVGMTAEVRAQAFEPFFTTKEFGESSGLGLSSALGVVEELGGTIALDSAPGAGTTVVIELPLFESQAPPLATEAAAARPLTILVVEDDEPVRNLLGLLLAESGHLVISAASGAQARECLASREIDLLLSDIVLPDARGWEVARSALERKPAVAVIYTSGFAGESMIPADAPRACAFLAKPFSGQDLEHALAQALVVVNSQT
jgi:PAS domain S-box-containing protein